MAARVRVAVFLILAAAAARALVQVAAMPPYAGLDEIYHVARISFVMTEGRNPTAAEASVPVYLHASMRLAPGALPDFVSASTVWPAYVAQRSAPLTDRPMPPQQKRMYLTPNYQAQQPSPYYRLAALVADLFSATTPLQQLRLWRLMSGGLAVVIAAAAMYIGYLTFGASGVMAASVMMFLPTWHTLTIRASNDALACALLATALAITLRGGRTAAAVAEGLLWAGAIATKLFTWPALVVLPLVWRRQRAARSRVVIVSILCVGSIIVTAADLYRRTGVAVGLGAFRMPGAASTSYSDIAYFEVAKVTIASAIWTSGQHNNALTGAGMLLYVLPVVALLLAALVRRRPSDAERFWLLLATVVVLAFGVAQLIHLAAHVRNAVAAGETMPRAGKEGWYWFVLAPLAVAVVGGYLLKSLNAVLQTAVLCWAYAWDVVITQGALVRDYAGSTSPTTPSVLFRWGPAPRLPFDAMEQLKLVAVGPLTEFVAVLHVIAVMAAVGAVAMLISAHDQSRAA